MVRLDASSISCTEDMTKIKALLTMSRLKGPVTNTLPLIDKQFLMLLVHSRTLRSCSIERLDIGLETSFNFSSMFLSLSLTMRTLCSLAIWRKMAKTPSMFATPP